MNNYYWNKRNVSLDKDEIAPWKLPREKHATISVLCQTRIIRTLQKRRYLCALLQILGWCTYSTAVLAFATNHQKYRRFCCRQV